MQLTAMFSHLNFLFKRNTTKGLISIRTQAAMDLEITNNSCFYVNVLLSK